MTYNEVNFAFEQRAKVVLARGSVVIMKPMAIRALTKIRRSEFEEERGKGKYYYEAQLNDSSGRGIINAGFEQLDPAEPEKFAAMLAWYNEAQARKAGGSDGV